MLFFGNRLWTHGHTTINPPLGLVCIHCEEPVKRGDSGVILPVDGEHGTVAGVLHRECLLRDAFGSVGHQRHKCPCYGGTEEDPPELTKREAAKAATELGLSRFANAKKAP